MMHVIEAVQQGDIGAGAMLQVNAWQSPSAE
jgi:hypothetical protein